MGADYSCKVDRVIDTYDLEESDPRHASIDEGLLKRWRGDDGHEGAGYRTLASWFNRRLLRRAVRDAGREAPASRIEYEYDALTGEDELVRAEVSERLRADGVDAERVREDFVSWGTLRKHLRECLEGEKPRAEAGDWERESIEVARSVTREKVESALSSLETKGELADLDTTSVTVQIQLQCTACPTRAPLEIALERGYVCAEHAGIES